MDKTNPAAHVRVIEETDAYWRVVFYYPPFNIVDASIFEALQAKLAGPRYSGRCLRRSQFVAVRSVNHAVASFFGQ
jgi:hypothetical protein